MQQNINIFILIGLVTLASGKLQGSVRQESTEEIREEFNEMKRLVKDELAKSPDNYQEVNFSKAATFIEKIHEILPLLEQKPYKKEELEKMALELKENLANALFINLTKLSGTIIEKVEEITSYFDVIVKTSTPFDFDNSFIKNPITNAINPRLDSISQQGLLSDKDILAQVDNQLRCKALQDVKKIILSVEELLIRFSKYLEELNTIIEKKKENFTKDHFDKTAQAIQTMKWFTDELYIKLLRIFSPILNVFFIFPDHPKIQNFISMFSDNPELLFSKFEQTLSKFKQNLYRIYGVKQLPFSNKISIKTYSRLLKGLRYSYPQDDPLKNISPSFSQPSTTLRKFGTQAVAILAAEMTDRIVQAVKEGMPLKEAVLMAIKGLKILGTIWAAKEGLVVIKAVEDGLIVTKETEETSAEESEVQKDVEAFMPTI